MSQVQLQQTKPLQVSSCKSHLVNYLTNVTLDREETKSTKRPNQLRKIPQCPLSRHPLQSQNPILFLQLPNFLNRLHLPSTILYTSASSSTPANLPGCRFQLPNPKSDFRAPRAASSSPSPPSPPPPPYHSQRPTRAAAERPPTPAHPSRPRVPAPASCLPATSCRT